MEENQFLFQVASRMSNLLEATGLQGLILVDVAEGQIAEFCMILSKFEEREPSRNAAKSSEKAQCSGVVGFHALTQSNAWCPGDHRLARLDSGGCGRRHGAGLPATHADHSGFPSPQLPLT